MLRGLSESFERTTTTVAYGVYSPDVTSDPKYILPIADLGVLENLSYEEVSVEILDCQVKMLRNKEGASLKVLWRNYLVEGATGRPRTT